MQALQEQKPATEKSLFFEASLIRSYLLIQFWVLMKLQVWVHN